MKVPGLNIHSSCFSEQGGGRGSEVETGLEMKGGPPGHTRLLPKTQVKAVSQE